MTEAVRPLKLAGLALGCVLLVLLFFSPRFWLMQDVVPGSFQWTRAETYLRQCEQPFRRDVEPAMQWRLLPPLVANFLNLPGRTPFLLPWAGVLALVGYIAVLHARRLPDPRYVLGGTLLAATTSAVLVPLGWLGINDAWVWLGLLAVAFGQARWAVPAACALCPWIDERFIIGLPLAWLVRALDGNTACFSRSALSLGWLLPYFALRLAGGGNPLTEGASAGFLATQAKTPLALLPMAPLGWWLGLRAGWASLVYAATTLPAERRWSAGLLLGTTLLVMLVLASDISRSAAILLPAVLWGGFSLARHRPEHAPRIMLWAACANLLLPAAHVVATKIDPISPLPVELFRLFRQ